MQKRGEYAQLRVFQMILLILDAKNGEKWKKVQI